MKNLFLYFVVIISTSTLYSQSTIPAASGNSSGAGGSSSFTIGQVNYIAISSNGQSLTQGVQQPVEIQTLAGPAFLIENFEIKVYPNPTSELVFLEIPYDFQPGYAFSILDIRGEEISKGIINELTTVITIKNFANGIYFLKVTNQNVPNRVFKIIKK